MTTPSPYDVPTKRDLRAAGIKATQLAQVLGVHPTTISDMMSGLHDDRRPVPGALAILWLWPRISEIDRAFLLAGRQFVPYRRDLIEAEG